MCLIPTTLQVLFFSLGMLLPGACLEDKAEAICLSSCESRYTPAPVPALPAVTEARQPLYFFLFTHTEDQFNHELSEARYTRFVPEIFARAQSHPEAGLKWTIMFQGSDAQTVAERNATTGVADHTQCHVDGGI